MSPEHFSFSEYTQDNLPKELICHSVSPGGALVLIVKRKDESLCLCVGYWALSQVMVQNQCPFPLIIISILMAELTAILLALAWALNVQPPWPSCVILHQGCRHFTMASLTEEVIYPIKYYC